MSRARLRWQQLVNQLHYLHEEYELIKEIAAQAAPDFQDYYDSYCRENNIDRDSLTRQIPDWMDKTAHEEVKQTEEPCDTREVTIATSEHGEEHDQVIEREDGEISEDSVEYKTFHRLFKQLALHLHPDRLIKHNSESEKAERTRMFSEAKRALKQRQYFKLIEYAKKFDVPIPDNYEEQKQWMRREIKHMQQKINTEKITYNYSFAICETREQKDQLMKRFLVQVYGKDVFPV